MNFSSMEYFTVLAQERSFTRLQKVFTLRGSLSVPVIGFIRAK